MPISTTNVYTCDRDGVVSEPVTNGAMPEGWSNVTISTMQASLPPNTYSIPLHASMLLCPACTTLLEGFKKVTP